MTDDLDARRKLLRWSLAGMVSGTAGAAIVVGMMFAWLLTGRSTLRTVTQWATDCLIWLCIIFMLRSLALTRRIYTQGEVKKMTDKHVIHPAAYNWTLPPGAVLREVLTERGMRRDEIAGIAPEVIDGIINAEVKIDETIAQRLYETLGISADYWLRFEKMYREDIARGAKDCGGD